MSRVLDLFSQLGIEIDTQLYQLALTHSSFAYENGRLPDNERLEFLGDAVLEIIVTEHLYRSFPDDTEGRLAKLRAAVVNAKSLAKVARELGLGGELLLGKGELSTGGSEKNSLLADAMEAVIGAIYLSSGYAGASRFVHHVIDPLIEQAVLTGAGLDWKTSLQELVSQRDLGTPIYEVEEDGPDHSKVFTAWVRLGDWVGPAGEGTSKKQAEQGAARGAYQQLHA
ncbi:MAG: ribonuclease III [Propionibacteriaceae bacterium]|nr:ribonuclease III [Propionibacteriaceae bacterium]